MKNDKEATIGTIISEVAFAVAVHTSKVGLALFLATAISPDRPTCYPADWETKDSVNPDLVIGGTNDWWLKTSVDGSQLYIQARHRTGGYAKGILAKFTNLAKIYAEITGITVSVPVVCN